MHLTGWKWYDFLVILLYRRHWKPMRPQVLYNHRAASWLLIQNLPVLKVHSTT